MATEKIRAGLYEAYIPGHGWVRLAEDVRTRQEAQRVARTLGGSPRGHSKVRLANQQAADETAVAAD
jgi:hypothetical protein